MFANRREIRIVKQQFKRSSEKHRKTKYLSNVECAMASSDKGICLEKHIRSELHQYKMN